MSYFPQKKGENVQKKLGVFPSFTRKKGDSLKNRRNNCHIKCLFLQKKLTFIFVYFHLPEK